MESETLDNKINNLENSVSIMNNNYFHIIKKLNELESNLKEFINNNSNNNNNNSNNNNNNNIYDNIKFDIPKIERQHAFRISN
tara:strand:+ start:68 stop:316 length:249 start_codon:yes stop_codon:yes gene_type:complete